MPMKKVLLPHQGQFGHALKLRDLDENDFLHEFFS
jgi:hypothetical protein